MHLCNYPVRPTAYNRNPADSELFHFVSSDLYDPSIVIVGLSFPFYACCGELVLSACMFHI